MSLKTNQVYKDLSNINIYRFKLSDEIISMLMAFAKLHQFDDRVSFKEAWVIWIKLYREEIEIERNRLLSLGYTDNVESKLFKSTRYYFRKKLSVQIQHDVVNDAHVTGDVFEPTIKKKNYVALDIGILEVIDLHIKRIGEDNNYSPAEGWENFCEGNKIIVAVEITRIMREADLTKNIAMAKVKKAYKNKYFQYSRSLNQV